MKKIISMLSLFLAIQTPIYAKNVTASAKATATLAASCQISAQDVLFGVINPQTSSSGVSATSNMSLYCSKGAAYSISLGYGNANYQVYVGCPSGCPVNQAQWNTYSPSGTLLGSNFYSNSAFIPNYGQLKGAVSNEGIQYKITLPGDDTKIWTRGNYNYANTGTGATQTFPIKATLTTTSYPTPDIYSDIVTAIVTF